MSVRFGYKASAEQFGPSELLELGILAEWVGLESVAVFGPLPAVAALDRACPELARVAGRSGPADRARDDGDERPDAHDAGSAVDHRPGVRNVRVPEPGPRDPRRRATIYDRPDEQVPIYVAASGPLAAKLAGRVADGFICTSGKPPELYEQLLDKVREGAESAGRDSARSSA
jgi:hypothetical protein